MQRTTLAVMRTCALISTVAFVLVTTPACANFDNADSNAQGQAPALQPSNSGYQSGMPTSLQPPVPVRDGDNPNQPSDVGGSINNVSLNSGNDNDGLAGFGPSSGTVVGNRALELRDEVLRLRASVNLNSNEFAIQRSGGTAGSVQYHSTVAAITARLQNGTTKGNPILLRQWDEANSALNEVGSSMGRLNSLQTSVEADASLAAYLLGSIQAAFDLSGAVDEDHDQLKILRDEVSRMSVKLDYLRTQIANDIERQTSYLSSERANMQALAFAISRGELLGNSLANRPIYLTPTPMSTNPAPMMAPMAAPVMSVQAGISGPSPMSPSEYMRETAQANQPPAPPPMNATSPENGLTPDTGQLLVLIRYNRPVVDYEAQLSQAVGAALERRPNAQFSVVAVSPVAGDPADVAREEETASRNAESVKRSLVQLGLAPSRLTSASTQSQNATTPEVHVYIR